jgi:hypothetical protein
MKVVFLSHSDWANWGYMFSKSLNKVGVESIAYCSNPHRYNYHEMAIKYGKTSKTNIINADVIVFMHSEFVNTGIDLSNKIIAVVHAGSKYRNHSERINSIFNPIVDVSFCSSDLLGRGPKNEVCIQGAIDTDYLQPVYSNLENKTNIVIGHYPSGPKKHEIITKVVNKVKRIRKNIDFRCDLNNVSHEEQIKRVSECDIYIEEMTSVPGDTSYSTFGTTALECAALGKIVCTRFPDLLLYEKLFGKCEGIQVTNTEKELEDKLLWILSLSNIDFIELQKKARQWVVDRHSPEVIGLWLKNQLEIIQKEKG